MKKENIKKSSNSYFIEVEVKVEEKKKVKVEVDKRNTENSRDFP